MTDYVQGTEFYTREPDEQWETSPIYNALGTPITEFFHAVIGGLSYVRDPRPRDRDQLDPPSFMYSNTLDLACFGIAGIDSNTLRSIRFPRYNLCAHGDIADLLKISNDELMLHPIGLF
jgi:hypothetical protein